LFKIALIWLNKITSWLLFGIVLLGNLPTVFVFLPVTIWFALPSYLTARSLQQKRTNPLMLELIIYNLLWLLVVGVFLTIAVIKAKSPWLWLSAIFILAPIVNLFAFIKKPEMF
jgi:hypothetical protein